MTIRDSLGYLSSPQSIIVSTTNNVYFSDGTSSFTVSNPYASVSLSSRDANTWNIINTFAFPLNQTVANVKTLAASTITGTNVSLNGILSTNQIFTNTISARSTSQIFGPLFVSTLVVGVQPNQSIPYETTPGYSAYIVGNTHITSNAYIGGNVIVGGNTSLQSSLTIGDSLAVTHSLTVNGFTTFRGPITVLGTGAIECQSINAQSTLSVVGNATFNSALIVNSSIQVGTILTAATVQTSTTQITGGSNGIIHFNPPSGPVLRNQGTGLTITSGLYTPVVSTQSLSATNGISTNTLTVLSTFSGEGITQFRLSSAAIVNTMGSLLTGNVETNSLQVNNSITSANFTASTFTASSCIIQNSIVGISPSAYLSTATLFASTILVNTISTGNVTINSITAPQIQVSTLNIIQNIICNPAVSTIILTSSVIENSQGSINTNIITTSSLFTSSLLFQTGTFTTPNPFVISAPVTTFQSTITGSITTSTMELSTLTATKVSIGIPSPASALGPDFFYSTIGGPSTNIVISGGPGNYLSPIYISSIRPTGQDPTDPYTSYVYFQTDYKSNPPPPGALIQYTANFFWGGAYPSQEINSYLHIGGGAGPTLYGTNGDQIRNGTLDASSFSVEGFLYGNSRFSLTFNYTYNPTATYIDSNAVIEFNNGSLRWNYALNGTTIQNSLNDMSIRNIYYYGSLNFASDPRIKEDIHEADLAQCYDTIRNLPLRSYKYKPEYCSTFHIGAETRLGFLATDLLPHFPKSVHTSETLYPSLSTPLLTIDTAQVEMAHLGATKYIIAELDRLESILKDFSR